MNNFSIAPWKLAHSYDTAYIRTIRDAQGEHIAHVCDLDDALPEAIANARLMAAAPELLAVLRDLLSRAEQELDQTATCEGLENCDALARCRAAIAAATGDQTINA
jgi:hypothetical protein